MLNYLRSNNVLGWSLKYVGILYVFLALAVCNLACNVHAYVIFGEL